MCSMKVFILFSSFVVVMDITLVIARKHQITWRSRLFIRWRNQEVGKKRWCPWEKTNKTASRSGWWYRRNCSKRIWRNRRIHRNWRVVQRKKCNKRVSYCQGKYLSSIALRDQGSSKIKRIDVSLKGISTNSKTIRPNQLDAVFKKHQFDNSGLTPIHVLTMHAWETHAPRPSLPFRNHVFLLMGLHTKLGHLLIHTQHKKVCQVLINTPSLFT